MACQVCHRPGCSSASCGELAAIRATNGAGLLSLTLVSTGNWKLPPQPCRPDDMGNDTDCWHVLDRNTRSLLAACEYQFGRTYSERVAAGNSCVDDVHTRATLIPGASTAEAA